MIGHCQLKIKWKFLCVNFVERNILLLSREGLSDFEKCHSVSRGGVTLEKILNFCVTWFMNDPWQKGKFYPELETYTGEKLKITGNWSNQKISDLLHWRAFKQAIYSACQSQIFHGYSTPSKMGIRGVHNICSLCRNFNLRWKV